MITETYLMLDVLPTEDKANKCAKYFKTKFVRALIALGTTALMYTKECFQFVPLFNYSTDEGIDWDESISSIDNQLKDYFNLDLFEREYIESMIKPME